MKIVRVDTENAQPSKEYKTVLFRMGGMTQSAESKDSI
jgi:hypothetical protein